MRHRPWQGRCRRESESTAKGGGLNRNKGSRETYDTHKVRTYGTLSTRTRARADCGLVAACRRPRSAAAAGAARQGEARGSRGVLPPAAAGISPSPPIATATPTIALSESRRFKGLCHSLTASSHHEREDHHRPDPQVHDQQAAEPPPVRGGRPAPWPCQRLQG